MTNAVFWGLVLIGMLALEAATMQLYTIWFAIGALFSALGALFGASFGWQIALFFVVSVISLLTLFPLVRRHMASKKTPTNADRIIGEEAIVTEDIDTVSGTGQIKVLGAVWSAVAEENAVVCRGEKVTVQEIKGVKAVVRRG